MDTIETIKCPACGEVMDKIFIPSEGINIDICLNGCGGIFFDNREFDLFNEQGEDVSFIQEQLKGKHFKKVDENAERKCPACGAVMVKNTTAVGGNVTVDDCYVCGGKFLDHDELFKIRDEFATDKDRQKAAMEYLFNVEGETLNKINNEAVKRKLNKNLGQKILYSLFDMND